MEGFWYGDSQVQLVYPQYFLDFGSFSLPYEITTVFSQVGEREEQGQDGQDEDGDNDN